MALVWLAVLAAPREAAAQATFYWTAPSGGNWNDAANWLHANGPVGPGYPSQPEDTAYFIDDHIPASQAITIPPGVTVTVGVMIFNLTPQITITTSLPAGRLVFDNGSNPALINRFKPANHTFFVDIELASDLHINASDSAEYSMTFLRAISESGGSRNLVLDGYTRFEQIMANSYTGTTTVLNGLLAISPTASGVMIPGNLIVGDGAGEPGSARVNELWGRIAASADIQVSRDGDVSFTRLPRAGFGPIVLGDLTVQGGRVGIGGLNLHIRVATLTMEGGHITSDFASSSTLTVDGTIAATSVGPLSSIPGSRAIIDSGGGLSLRLATAAQQFVIADGPEAIDAEFNIPITALGTEGVNKLGAGVALFGGNNTYTGETTVTAGTLLVNGNSPSSTVQVAGGRLGGTGTVGALNASTGAVTPGTSPGVLRSGAAVLAAGVEFGVEIESTAAYDQLQVTGTVNIGDSLLVLTAPLGLQGAAIFTIINNDGTDPVGGTFAGLAEGATVTAASGAMFRISYVGGDGNDVALTNITPLSYFLSEGATGSFFDEDVLIANPNTVAAPVTLTFLLPGGGTIVEQRTVAPQSRLTLAVEDIPGLEAASASVRVVSEAGLPLAVERTMFWDASHYGGHTANAVDQARTEWHFAEGSQGFFDTYLLLANANATPGEATVTFLRENNTPVTETVPVAAFSRVTVHAGEYPALAGQSFGMTVTSTLPITAERAMYFQSSPARLWSGGHANVGSATPSTSWFHPEGATGTFFSTFILIGNPQTSPAEVTLRFLLPSGETVDAVRTIPAQQRLTINPADLGDVRLQNTALSTVVTSDVPVVSERAMYWPEGTTPLGEGHASSGVVSTALTWDLAEGRSGGPSGYTTYILLANPSADAANVTVTFLRETGAAVTKTFTVPPTSRYNIDVGVDAPELAGESFGARVSVTNAVPIAVERSLYWNANGTFWSGGTNALASPLPQ